MGQVDQSLSNPVILSGGVARCAMRATLTVIAVTAFAGSVGSACAETSVRTRAADFIHVVGHAGPTPAWTRFCHRKPTECQVSLSQPARISLTPGVWAILTKVNERVNSMILPVTDQDHWGVLDRWDYPDDGLGDCEDIQLLKRKLLVKAGLPHRALRMAAVIDGEGQGHAVLMVLTDKGDFILDNKRESVLPWRQTNYTFIKREDADNKGWVAFGDQTAPTMTAHR